MKSKDEIKSDLQLIAKNHEMTGEAVDMIIDLLTYSMYHEQVNILNTAKEMSLNDAYSINSKIALCDNVMYSVFRGTCPIVHLNTHFDSNTYYNKFDLLYTSNTFYLYALDKVDHSADIDTESVTQVDAILTRNKLIEKTVECTYNQYYIDLVDDVYGNTYSDISDDVMVTIDGRMYGTTRIFADHCKSVGDDELIFILTIPDYGIRLYKKHMFGSGSIVEIKAIVYTTLDDINEDDINNIRIPGLRFLESPKLDSNGDIIINEDGDEEKIKPIDYSAEISRQDSDSLLYYANFASRVDHEIKSNSDVNYLFSEVYIKYVESSTFRYVRKGEIYGGNELTEDTLYISYIPKPGDQLGPDDFEEFSDNYGSYFICNKIVISQAKRIDINLNIRVVVTNGESIYEEVQSILNSEFNKKLGLALNEKLLQSMISKIDNVKYLDNFELIVVTVGESDSVLNPTFDQYFVITPNIVYVTK